MLGSDTLIFKPEAQAKLANEDASRCAKFSEATSSRTTGRETEVAVRELNQVLSGWTNCFRVGYVTGAWQIVQQRVCRRLCQWLKRKAKL